MWALVHSASASWLPNPVGSDPAPSALAWRRARQSCASRSIGVALTAAAMNLLAAGASFGAIVAIFQWGWLSEPLGLG